MSEIKEDKAMNELKKNVSNTISNLDDKDLSLSNIIENIDYINKVRYTEDEIIKGLIRLIKEHSKYSY